MIGPLKGTAMTRSMTLLAGTAVILAAVSGAAAVDGTALAQGTPQTLSLMKVDPQSLATGYRASKVIGSTVVNEADENVGTIDDLIVTPTEKVPFAVLSVGGFLGIGEKYVVVPYSALEVHGQQMMLRGATNESLKSLPEFNYRT
jgi:sporulation protein YlmC with PRC-barrel domain